MIDPKELRIGNIVVETIAGRIGAVIGVTEKKIKIQLEYSKLNTHPDQIAAVILEEHWLARFGFQFYKNPNGTESFIFKNGVIKIVYSNEFGYRLRDWHESNFKINFVHQLQNLFFALTGEELNLTTPERS